MIQKASLFLIGLLLVSLVSSCSATYDVYHEQSGRNLTVVEGMTTSEVEGLLGAPSHRDNRPGNRVDWYYRNFAYPFVVHFLLGEVESVEQLIENKKRKE